MYASHDLNYALQATQNWISDLAWRLRWHDRERVYRALIVTLHALRDCLDRDEAVYMGAQLPDLLRGFYYEAWHPGRRVIRAGAFPLLAMQSCSAAAWAHSRHR